MPDSPAAITRARVFIVDDHPLVRESLATLIDRQPDLCIGGQATDSATAFAAMLREPVEVALVDLSLPGESGLELIKRLQALTPPPRIVVLSMHDEALYAERALRAGAMGYVMKQESTDRVLVAIREVLKGRAYVSNDLAARFALRLVGNSHSVSEGDSPATELSDRELDVFRLIGEGRATKRIAHDLRISVKTVQTHCANIKDKLGLANSHELICEAVRWVESTKFKN
ncbi:MAG TPA: response regulator transcription factor [Lacunisphaera sp.]